LSKACTLVLMVAGIELQPASAFVGPLRSALFQARAPSSAVIVGLLVGSRLGDDDWTPAIERVTVELVAIHGVKLGGGIAMLPEGLGWQFYGRVRIGETIAVCVRNDQRAVVELRAVLAIEGGGEARRESRLRISAPRKR
jgi:hypothetical protein